MVAELIAEGEIRLADGTLIACANYPGCASKSEFAGHASYGYCPSKTCLSGACASCSSAISKAPRSAMTSSDQDRPGARQRAVRRRRLWGREYDASMDLIDVRLITPDKHKLGARPPSETAKARIRLVIESVFSNPKGQTRLDQHLAKTPPGLAQRIAQRLLALTLDMFINALCGRPPRALAAYDGQ